MYKALKTLAAPPVWIFPLLLLLPACQEDEIVPYAIEGAYNCYQDNSWTAGSVEAALIGEWDRVYFSCFSGEMGEVPAGELLLVLTDDHKLEIYQDGLLERTDTWEVVARGSENFELKTSQSLPWLKGDIVICEDLLVFFESYVAGCDNYFEKR